MNHLRTAAAEKWTSEPRPPGCPAHSVGRFRLRADGTSRFDRHHHDFDEFWFVASGAGIVQLGDHRLTVEPGDVVYTPAGTDHDVVAVVGHEDLHVFWLSWTLPAEATGGHLHRTPEDATKHLVPAQDVS